MAVSKAQLEAAARGSQNDMRAALLSMAADLQSLQIATGTSSVSSSNAGQSSSQPAPAAPILQVAGANGTYTVTLIPPALTVPATIFYELSHSSSSTFSNDTVTLPPSAATAYSIAAPGLMRTFRVRASLDQKTWSAYRTGTAPVDAGLQTSSATSPNIPLNQTNAATIDSIAQGGTVFIRIYGASGGVGTPWTNTSGKVFPSASIVGEMPGQDAFVAWDPAAQMYRVRYRLSGVFPDSYVIVGQVSIVTLTPPMLPTITPYILSGGIVGYNITNGGSGITAPLTITINDPDGLTPGSGAVPGAQTISGGVLLAIAPGAPGHGYSGDTTVTASGGLASVSAPGGGGVSQTNGGRLTNV